MVSWTLFKIQTFNKLAFMYSVSLFCKRTKLWSSSEKKYFLRFKNKHDIKDRSRTKANSNAQLSEAYFQQNIFYGYTEDLRFISTYKEQHLGIDSDFCFRVFYQSLATRHFLLLCYLIAEEYKKSHIQWSPVLSLTSVFT